MKSKILFRADGNYKIGLGHLYRLFALYEIYKDFYDCVFVTRSDSALSVIPSDYNLKILPIDISLRDESIWIKGKFADADIIIADGYHFNSSYQKSIKDKGFKLIYIDDLAQEFMYADIVINHSPNIKSGDYNASDYTKFALSTKYAILRPGFLEAAKKQRTINKIDTAFVCFGGSDINNLTLKAVKALLQIKQIKKINTVIGDANQNIEIYKIQKDNTKINIYKNLSEEELISVMQESNFAIAPASTILFELCTINMSILSGYYVDNQKNIYEHLVAKHAIFGIGSLNNKSVIDFKNHINNFINTDYSFQVNNQYQLFDGNIRNRFLTLLKNL